MRRIPLLLALVSAGALLGTAAFAQSFNVDFGDAASAPSAAYPAAGLPGVWNAIPVLPGWQRAPLVQLDGSASGAEIYIFGGVEMLTVNDPATTGDHQALLDDMLIGWNDPVDVCIWFDGLAAGSYEVLTYALTPSNPLLRSRVRVDTSTEGPEQIGGAWGGSHVEGLSYAKHPVTVTANGEIAMHSGLWDANVQSGMNGIQIRRIIASDTGEQPPDLPYPSLRVFPNPSRSEQTLWVPPSAAVGVNRLELFDLSGRLVWSRALPFAPSGLAIVWDGRGASGEPVPSGIYLARIAGTEHSTRVLRLP